MRLLTILQYTSMTGVGTWNYTFLKAIKDKHPDSTIDVWFKTSPTDSLLIRQLSKVVDNIYFELPTNEYDIVYTNYAQKEYPKTKKIYHFVHNIMANNYMNPYADKIFVFSERAYNYVEHSNKILIRNAIDLKRFKYKKPVTTPSKVLVFDSRNNAFMNSKVLAACSMNNLYLSFLGQDSNNGVENRWNVEDYIKTSDIVLAVGRSAIEALAMGKTVIIANADQANGIVTADNFLEHAETNFSGWTKHRVDNYSMPYISKQLKKCKSSSLRELVKEYYDIQSYVSQLIS